MAKHTLSAIRLSSSAIALTAAALAVPAFAQETAPQAASTAATADDGAIVVTGYRASLNASASIKRGAPTIVEAVSAQDIGKLPDVSIADSLARLPGVTAQRLEGRGAQRAERAAREVGLAQARLRQDRAHRGHVRGLARVRRAHDRDLSVAQRERVCDAAHQHGQRLHELDGRARIRRRVHVAHAPHRRAGRVAEDGAAAEARLDDAAARAAGQDRRGFASRHLQIPPAHERPGTKVSKASTRSSRVRHGKEV